MADFDPTAANIIASLGIKGATVGKTTGPQFEGYVPVLDANGKLSAELISMDTANLSIPALSNVAFVDPTTEAEHRKGSIVSPFKSLTEAAASFQPTDGYVAFVLAPGKYTDSIVAFANSPHKVYLIGLGECEFTATTISVGGISTSSESKIYIQGIRISGDLKTTASASLHVAGGSYVHSAVGFEGRDLCLASDSAVDETDANIVYLSNDSRIANTSTVSGETVKDALDTLDIRKIRLAKLVTTTDGTGRVNGVGISSEVDYSAIDSLYNLSDHDQVIVDGINQLFEQSKNIAADTVTATTVTADLAQIGELRINYLRLGGYNLTIDRYGYLVVNTGSETPEQPPDNVVLLRDTGTGDNAGATYILGIENGRMYVLRDDSDAEDADVKDALVVYDESNTPYTLSIVDGKMVVTKVVTTTKASKSRKNK